MKAWTPVKLQHGKCMLCMLGTLQNSYGPAFSGTLTPPPPSRIPGSTPATASMTKIIFRRLSLLKPIFSSNFHYICNSVQSTPFLLIIWIYFPDFDVIDNQYFQVICTPVPVTLLSLFNVLTHIWTMCSDMRLSTLCNIMWHRSGQRSPVLNTDVVSPASLRV